jgi:hypothetical protein
VLQSVVRAASIVLVSLVGLVPFGMHGQTLGSAPAAASATRQWPIHTVCSHALGIALRPAPHVQLLPPGKYPPGVLALGIPPPPRHGLEYDMRLVIGPIGTTIGRDDVRAAAMALERLIQQYPTPLTLRRRAVRYGGAPGILVRGLPGGPGPVAVIVLAHAGATYMIAAPGTTLAHDQRQMLASLYFIPRVGRFPSSNPPAPRGPSSQRHIPVLLRVAPNPVAIRQPYAVMLLGVRPGEWLTFAFRKEPEAMSHNRQLGRYRADAAGVVRFRPSPFVEFEAMGRWLLTAWSPTGHLVASSIVRVAGLLLRPHSRQVAQGKAYPFRLYTHCGANFSVDFDHSFWDLSDPSWADQPGGLGPHKGLGNPFQWGNITFVDSVHARFDFVPNMGAPGAIRAVASIQFTRHRGPKVVPSFCA